VVAGAAVVLVVVSATVVVGADVSLTSAASSLSELHPIAVRVSATVMAISKRNFIGAFQSE
jgi:hypothetical protein